MIKSYEGYIAVVTDNIDVIRPRTTSASEITFRGGNTINVDMEFHKLIEHIYGISEEDIKEDIRKAEEIADPPLKESTDLDDCGLSVRSYMCLKRAGYNTLGDILDLTDDQVLSIRNMGKRSGEEVINLIQKNKSLT